MKRADEYRVQIELPQNDSVMEILAYVLYSQCSVALLSIVDHAS